MVCADWVQRCGRCDGCCGHLPGWTVTGYLCADCRELRLVTRQRPKTLAERVQVILAEATEQAWQALAESPGLDPMTVAVCKRLRDMERGL